jgi:hypothetical protein
MNLVLYKYDHLPVIRFHVCELCIVVMFDAACSYSRPQNKVIKHMKLTQHKGPTVLFFDVALQSHSVVNATKYMSRPYMEIVIMRARIRLLPCASTHQTQSLLL